MKISKLWTMLFFFLSLILFRSQTQACSMYKLTADGKTMVGCNQDAWRTTTSIWFKNPKDEKQYGACFTGSRRVGPNKYAPQSGMNEVGLVFSRLVAYHPKKNLPLDGKKQITNEVDYLSNILHECKTVDEVRKFIDMYDHSFFIDEVFIYIDKSGDYLIVEPYELIKGNDPSYVLANFCPSLTSNQDARKLLRYKSGEDYLRNNTLNPSLDYCRTVSDTMSVCRSRNGDGTLLTSIWDTDKGLVNLYFYHSYDTTIQYNITEELALGNHIISIPELFPANPEFERLLVYKTPIIIPAIRLYLAVIGIFIIGLSFLFSLSFFRRINKFNSVKLLFAGLNVLLFMYLFILARNTGIFYFDAPYKHHSSGIISLSSYIPFLLLLLIVPISYYNFRFLRSNSNSFLLNTSLVANNVIYLMLLFAFGYWGLFDVWN